MSDSLKLLVLEVLKSIAGALCAVVVRLDAAAASTRAQIAERRRDG